MTPDQIKVLFDIADTITTVALLFALLVLFFRGDILSRKVYEELTKDIVGKMVEQVTDSVCDVIDRKFDERK